MSHGIERFKTKAISTNRPGSFLVKVLIKSESF